PFVGTMCLVRGSCLTRHYLSVLCFGIRFRFLSFDSVRSTMDLIPEFRAEFDQLVDSMHHQLDVHAEALFQLFISRLNTRALSHGHDLAHESRQPQLAGHRSSVQSDVATAKLEQNSGTKRYLSFNF